METTLELAPEQPGEAPMKQLAPFDAQRIEAEKLKKTAETLTVTSIEDKAGMALARTTRLALKSVRVEVTHRHKELKEHFLVEGRKIDAGKNEILAIIEPLEARLLEQEQFSERAEAARKEELRAMRAEELQSFGVNSSFINLAEMPDAEYDALFNNSKAAHETKIAAEKKAEEDRIAREKSEAEERQRIAEENIRLKAEAQKREAEMQAERQAMEAKAQAEREKAAEVARVAAEKARKEREAVEAKARAEREKFEAEVRKQREEAEAIAKKDRLAREKAEAELKAKQQAEEKAKKEAEAAAKKAARAPDKAKLIAFGLMLCELESPAMTTVDGKAIREELNERINSLCEWIDGKASSL